LQNDPGGDPTQKEKERRKKTTRRREKRRWDGLEGLTGSAEGGGAKNSSIAESAKLVRENRCKTGGPYGRVRQKEKVFLRKEGFKNKESQGKSQAHKGKHSMFNARREAKRN